MAQTLLPPLNLYSIKLFSSNNPRSQSRVVSIRKLRSIVLQASKNDMEAGNSGFNPASSSNPLFSFINAHSWLAWLTGGSVLGPSASFYRRIRNTQDRVETTVEEVANTMENVAENVEKISSKIGSTLPEGTLKKVVLQIEKTANIVDEGAEKIGSFIEKLDEIEAKVDAVVDPFNKGEAHERR